MLRYKHLFRVEILRCKYLLRVELLRYNFLLSWTEYGPPSFASVQPSMFQRNRVNKSCKLLWPKETCMAAMLSPKVPLQATAKQAACAYIYILALSENFRKTEIWDATSNMKVATMLTHKDGGGQWNSQISQICVPKVSTMAYLLTLWQFKSFFHVVKGSRSIA